MASDFSTVAIIQARMSSRRLPGKVLIDLDGRPVIDHVIARVREVMPRERIVVATSRDSSDDALAHHVEKSGIKVFRGPLENVFERFQLCLKEHPADWFLRICADSPLLNVDLLRHLLSYQHRDDIDLVTNVFPRTFPVGLSLEMLRAKTFSAIDSKSLSTEEQEHLTKVYYNNPQKFHIANVEARNPDLALMNFSLDTPEDLERIKEIIGSGGKMPKIEIKTAVE